MARPIEAPERSGGARFPSSTSGLGRWLARLGITAAVVGAISLAISCGANDDQPLGPALTSSGGPGGGSAGGDPGPCWTGQTRDCHVPIGTQNGVVSCLDGVETCKDGEWGPCEGSVVARPMPEASGASGAEGNHEANADQLDPSYAPPMKPLALSDAGACVNNPCDPSCQVFDEDPDAGIKPDGSVLGGSYTTGSLSGLPGGFENKGLKDPNHPPNGPCTSDASCQFDHYCNTATGFCVPWLPGQTNPLCAGADLTLGATCSNNVPVCNRGNTVAPAGVKITVLNGNSAILQGNLGVCASGSIQGTLAGECVTNVPIQPGECINVSCPAGVLGGTQGLMVNPPSPPGSTAPVAECTCANNWTVYSNGGTCQQASCSSTSASSTLSPVNMFIMFDNSQSMVSSGLWTPAKTAMKGFLQNPASAGLNIALRFFGNGCTDSSCNVATVNACGTPQVPLGTLTAVTGVGDPQETLLVNAINAAGTGGAGTPLYSAVKGPCQWATNYSIANPGGQEVVVIITDGDPTGCNTAWNLITPAAASALASQGVRTYVIGLFGSNQASLNSLAAAGGTGSAFFITSQNAATVQTQLQAAMDAIKGSSISCDLAIPNAANIDPNNVTVTYTPNMGSAQATTQVANAAGCTSGNQWYFDNNTTPTKITLCPALCSAAQGSPGSEINFVAGCPITYQPVTYTQIYQGACPAGTHVQWGYFAYNTLTPSDSNIVFEARTATTAAGLAPPNTSLATAKASPDTQVCPIAGPSPCPVDLYAKLGGPPKATNEFLEIVANMNPSTDKKAAPTLNSWELTYSCPATE